MPAENQIHSIDLIYAAALLDLAQEAGHVADINTEVRELGTLLASQTELIRLLSSQVLTAHERAASIKKIFQGNLSDLLYRFLQTVNAKGRLADLPGIIAAFVKLYEDRHGLVEADAYVAAPLDDAQAQRVAAQLGQATGRTVLLRQHADPALLGGLKVRIADRLIDGSVAAQLKILRQKMIDTGRDKAREQAARQ